MALAASFAAVTAYALLWDMDLKESLQVIRVLEMLNRIGYTFGTLIGCLLFDGYGFGKKEIKSIT